MFSLPDTFSALRRASGPVFMFCVPAFVFGGIAGVGSRFYILRFLTRFRRCGGRRVPFSYFAHPDLFLAIPRVSGPFSCFACPYSLLAVPRASGSVFMFCAPGLVFSRTEGVSYCFHVLHCQTPLRQYRRRRVPF
jgi:hypothetical protein